MDCVPEATGGPIGTNPAEDREVAEETIVTRPIKIAPVDAEQKNVVVLLLVTVPV